MDGTRYSVHFLDYVLRWLTADFILQKYRATAFMQYPFTFYAIIDLLSLSEFNQLKNGMTYDECVEIIGTEGKQQMEIEVLDISTINYVWSGERDVYKRQRLSRLKSAPYLQCLRLCSAPRRSALQFFFRILQ